MTCSSRGTLLYRASRDGFTAQAFHSKCDGKGPTVTIIKNNFNDVFGGFTNANWNSSGSHITDAKAFIFSLRRNGETKIEKFMVRNAEYALYGHRSYGPSFGANNDIKICNGSNSNYGSYCYFGQNFNVPNGYSPGQVNTQNLLGGNFNQWLTIDQHYNYKVNYDYDDINYNRNNWLTTEIEVYQIA